MPSSSRRAVPTVENVENRSLLATFAPPNAAALIAAVAAANTTPEADTISLVPGATYTLTAATDDSAGGPTGIPAVSAAAPVTIIGNGATIERSGSAGTPSFRLLAVSAGASLTAENLTLQGGLASSFAGAARGGAVFNAGTLILRNVVVQNNTAQGNTSTYNGTDARGAGVYSEGTLQVVGGVIRNNLAAGGAGQASMLSRGGPSRVGDGGAGLGGGVYVGGGTASLTSVSLVANTARGGGGGRGANAGGSGSVKWVATSGGKGGDGLGGGLHAAGGTVNLRDVSVVDNNAEGGPGGSKGTGKGTARDGSPGMGMGGGLYIGPNAVVKLDAATTAEVRRNRASSSHPKIYGSYTLLP